MGGRVALGLFLFLFLASLVLAQEEQKHYVGSRACADCHEEEYVTYQKFSKKAHSFEAVTKMRDKLTANEIKNCYQCHTTGYGKPGGFTDELSTPDLKNVGCEACHGPGSKHIKSEDPKDIWASHENMKKVCKSCHTREVSRSLSFSASSSWRSALKKDVVYVWKMEVLFKRCKGPNSLSGDSFSSG